MDGTVDGGSRVGSPCALKCWIRWYGPHVNERTVWLYICTPLWKANGNAHHAGARVVPPGRPSGANQAPSALKHQVCSLLASTRDLLSTMSLHLTLSDSVAGSWLQPPGAATQTVNASRCGVSGLANSGIINVEMKIGGTGLNERTHALWH